MMALGITTFSISMSVKRTRELNSGKVLDPAHRQRKTFSTPTRLAENSILLDLAMQSD